MQPKYLLQGALEFWTADFGLVLTQRPDSCLLRWQKSFAISNSLRVFEEANHSLCQTQSAWGFLGNFQEVLCQPPNKVQIKRFNVPARKTEWSLAPHRLASHLWHSTLQQRSQAALHMGACRWTCMPTGWPMFVLSHPYLDTVRVASAAFKPEASEASACKQQTSSIIITC